MNAITADKGTFTDEHQDALRDEVRAIMEREGMSQADVSKVSGVKYGTFTAWLSGTYAGRNENVAAEVQIWLEARKEQQNTLTKIPQAPGFQATTTARHILDVLSFAQASPDFVLVVGGAGIGKTTSLKRYQETNPNVWMITMSPTSSSPHALLMELCEEMRLSERQPMKLMRAIGRKVAGSNGLIIVDEAQHLTSKAIDQLRSIFDLGGVGVALAGNETVYSRLEGEGRKAGFAQMYSRIGMRITRPKPHAQDICALIKAWGIENKEQADLLKVIARKPGALRGMTKALKLASMLAAGDGAPLGVKHIKQAWSQLSSQDLAA